HQRNSKITMPIDRNLQDGQTRISPIHQVDGLNWRLRVERTHDDSYPGSYWLNPSIECEGDGSRELWRMEAMLPMKINHINFSRYVQ
ncbi:hypothetical protein PENTCL1PPCAC_13161, partial [Pristionchus entomophagus]